MFILIDHDVTLLNSHLPQCRWPQRCLVCNLEDPNATARFFTLPRNQGLLAKLTFSLKLPACRACAWRAHLSRVFAALLLWLLVSPLALLILATVRLDPEFMAHRFYHFGIWLVLFGLFCYLAERLYRPLFNVRIDGAYTELFFRNKSYLTEFEKLNPWTCTESTSASTPKSP